MVKKKKENKFGKNEFIRNIKIIGTFILMFFIMYGVIQCETNEEVIDYVSPYCKYTCYDIYSSFNMWRVCYG